MEAKKQRPEQEYLELKKAYEKNRIMMGEDHPDTHACLDRLAEYYDRIGDYDEAIELEEELLSKRNALYGIVLCAPARIPDGGAAWQACTDPANRNAGRQ